MVATRLNFCDLDNIRINAMGRSIEATIRAPITILPPGLALRAAMAIYALGIIAVQTPMARRHARNGSQNIIFIFSQFVGMIVVAVGIGALAQEEVVVAEFHLLNAV